MDKRLYLKKGWCGECLFGDSTKTCSTKQEEFFKTKKEAKCPPPGRVYASLADKYLADKRKERNYL